MSVPLPPTSTPASTTTPAPTDRKPGLLTAIDDGVLIDAKAGEMTERPMASSTATELSTRPPVKLMAPRTVALPPFSTAPPVARAGEANVSTPAPVSKVVPAQPE